MASVCLLYFMQIVASGIALSLTTTDGITVAMVTWNTADMHIAMTATEGKQVLLEAFTLAKVALQVEPDIWAVALQETLTPHCDIKINDARWLNMLNPDVPTSPNDPNGYLIVSQYWREPTTCMTDKFHGGSGIIVFAKKNWYQNIGRVGNFASDDKTFGNNEKGVSAVWFQTADEENVFCFGSSHLQTGDNYASPDRLNSFNKYEQFFEDFSAKLHPKGISPPTTGAKCTVKFYGGDFNWRNGIWSDEKGWKSEHHEDPQVKSMFANMRTGWHDSVRNLMIVKSNGGNYNAFPNALADVPRILTDNDERWKRNGNWMEGNVPKRNGNPKTYPTFQPLPTYKCGGRTNLLREENLINSTIGEKQPACYAINSNEVWMGCNNGEICFSSNRPLAYTDCIFHEGDVNAVMYGPMMIPVPSDHFPMLGTYKMY